MKPKLPKLTYLLIVIAVSYWLIGINEPFVGSYGANLNYFSLAAKNFLKFGYLNLHFLPTYYPGSDLSVAPTYYLHHPILYFTLVSLPYAALGFKNWVAAVTPIVFSLLTLYWLYHIAKEIWDKKTAFWSTFYASIFPMMTIFGRQTIFEPAVLSCLTACYYFMLRYLKTSRGTYLITFLLFSLLAILIDWGGAYFLFPLIALYKFFPTKREKFKIITNYALVQILGVSIFLLIVLFTQKNYTDLANAINSRVVNSELFNLSLPWFRLILLTSLRILIYFTPFVVLPLFVFIKDIYKGIKSKSLGIEITTLLFFLILGSINIVFLPAATFGHIYFLFYFLPFFAFLLGRFTAISIYKSTIYKVLIVSVVIYSGLITYLKWQQVKKQVWRYETAIQFTKILKPNVLVGVYGFPGDLLENYFGHPTKPLATYEEVISQVNEQVHPIIFSCWDMCVQEDIDFVDLVSLQYQVIPYHNNEHQLWLITPILNNQSRELPTTSDMQEVALEPSQSRIIKWYRKLRDLFKVGQL